MPWFVRVYQLEIVFWYVLRFRRLMWALCLTARNGEGVNLHYCVPFFIYPWIFWTIPVTVDKEKKSPVVDKDTLIVRLAKNILEGKTQKYPICDTICDKSGENRSEVSENDGSLAKSFKYDPKTTKKSFISARLLELIPGFEPGTSSLPKCGNGGCGGSL